jgi:hypothetical protein
MSDRYEIINEVRAARDAYAARFNYDVDAIFNDLMEKARKNPDQYVNLQTVKPKPVENPPDQR